MKNKFYDKNNTYSSLYISDDDDEYIEPVKQKEKIYPLCQINNNKCILHELKEKRKKNRYNTYMICKNDIDKKILEIEKIIIKKIKIIINKKK
jgi:hypothetical protein